MIRRIYGHKIGHMAKELELSKKDITCQKQRSKKKKSLQNQLLIPIIDNSTKLIKVLNTKKKKKRNQIVKS